MTGTGSFQPCLSQPSNKREASSRRVPPYQANFAVPAKEMVMLTSIEILRRKNDAVCSGCGWNVVVMEWHSECANPECVLLGKRQTPRSRVGSETEC
jgi:hypothetical protein